MIATGIVICEVGFWALIGAGLLARYGLARPRLGAALLLSAPLLDLGLCTLTTADLAAGATATWTHGLAAAYLGFSLAFGRSLVGWVDRRVVGAAQPTSGAGSLTREWRLWRRCLLACLLAAAMLALFVAAAGDAGRSAALWADGGWFAQLAAVSVVWLLLGPAWAHVAERRARRRDHRGRCVA